jgi:hypothetical protein
MAPLIRRLWADRSASATIEYVVLLLPLLALVFVSFQIALAYHFALTAQKAVELGARIASVRDPVSITMPKTNQTNSATGASFGDSCAEGACIVPAGGPWTCAGNDLGNGACDPVAYSEIFDEVARIAYLLNPADLSITYTYGGLGYAGGPFTPIVEVAIEERPFFLQFFFNLALSNPSNKPEALQLPAVAASAIAEDLSSSN